MYLRKHNTGKKGRRKVGMERNTRKLKKNPNTPNPYADIPCE